MKNKIVLLLVLVIVFMMGYISKGIYIDFTKTDIEKEMEYFMQYCMEYDVDKSLDKKEMKEYCIESVVIDTGVGLEINNKTE